MIASEQILQHVDSEASRRSQDPQAERRTFGKLCLYLLVLLMPGSFEVLALLWLYRRFALARDCRASAAIGRQDVSHLQPLALQHGTDD